MPIKSYRDLEAYQRARGLIVPVHQSEIVQPLVDEYTIVAKQLNKLIQNWL